MKSSEQRFAVLVIVSVAALVGFWLAWAISGDQIARYFTRNPNATGGEWGDTFGALNALISSAGWIGLILALRESRKANRIAASDKRAWIKITELSLAPYSDELRGFQIFEDSRAFVAVKLEGQNVGETPAHDVEVALSVLCYAGGYEVADVLADVGKKIVARQNPQLVFPRDIISSGMVGFGFDYAAAAAAIKSGHRPELMLAVDISYRVQGSPDRHSTGKVYSIIPMSEHFPIAPGRHIASLIEAMPVPPWAT